MVHVSTPPPGNDPGMDPGPRTEGTAGSCVPWQSMNVPLYKCNKSPRRFTHHTHGRRTGPRSKASAREARASVRPEAYSCTRRERRAQGQGAKEVREERSRKASTRTRRSQAERGDWLARDARQAVGVVPAVRPAQRTAHHAQRTTHSAPRTAHSSHRSFHAAAAFGKTCMPGTCACALTRLLLLTRLRMHAQD